MKSFNAVIWSVITLLCVTTKQSFAQLTGDQIMDANQSSILYLEVVGREDGKVVETASGFIISHDGFVLTAGHIKVGPNQELRAHVGQKSGAYYPLEFQQSLFSGDLTQVQRGTDMALWRLPPKPGCDRAVWMIPQIPRRSEALWAISFRTSGLSEHVLSVTNVQGPEGTFLVDGTLQVGESGGPVFNTDGALVGMLSGGHLATGQDLVVTPIRLGEPLLARTGQWPPRTKDERYPASCFAECENPAHGVVSWKRTEPWNASSGWLGGGNSQPAVCNGLARGFEQQNPGWSVEITNTSESSKEEFYRQFFYMYHCSGIAHVGPNYGRARSAACGIEQTNR